jgi:hypothetical protein
MISRQWLRRKCSVSVKTLLQIPPACPVGPDLSLRKVVGHPLSKCARIPPSFAGGMNGLPSPLVGEG